MARITTGARPDVQSKTWVVAIHDDWADGLRCDVEKYVEERARYGGVPDEATQSKEYDLKLRLTLYRYEWWEVTV